MEDLPLRPDVADAILGHIFDFYYEHHRRIFEAGRGRIDLTWVAEDLGSQNGPLMSLAMYRRFLLPNQIKMAELARSYGVHVMYHTDGAARMFLPDLIDRVGIEILNPIQWRCPGMEREKLVADFGRQIIFHGSIDNQHTLPFGAVDDVIREVRESVESIAMPAGSAPPATISRQSAPPKTSWPCMKPSGRAARTIHLENSSDLLLSPSALMATAAGPPDGHRR